MARAPGLAGVERRELAALAGLLMLGASLLGRHLGSPSLEFDEGVYLLSADLLGRGFELGRDVFSSQPPLFPTLLDGAYGLVGGSLAALHGLTVGFALRHGAAGRLWDWAAARADLLGVLAAGVVLIAVNRPIIHHHLVILAWPLALLVASTLTARLPRRALAAVGLSALLLVPWAARGRDTIEGAESVRIEAAAAVVERTTAPEQPVVSDLPLVPLAAERPAAPATVDPSAVRIGTGSLSRQEILAAADGAGAVVVGRSFDHVPGLAAELARRYPRIVRVEGIRIYVVEPARAPGHRSLDV